MYFPASKDKAIPVQGPDRLSFLHEVEAPILVFLCVLLVVLSCLLFWLLIVGCCWLTVCIFAVVLCVLLSYVYLLYYDCIAVFTLDAGLLARSQYF